MNNRSTEKGDVVIGQESRPLIGTQTLAICIALIALAVTAVTVFKVSVGSLFFIGALLACPLMHVLMMKGGNHKHE